MSPAERRELKRMARVLLIDVDGLSLEEITEAVARAIRQRRRKVAGSAAGRAAERAELRRRK